MEAELSVLKEGQSDLVRIRMIDIVMLLYDKKMSHRAMKN